MSLRTIRHGLGRAALAFLTAGACIWSPALRAEPVIGPRHGIAMHGQPALPNNFPHLPHVNPDAPKGGRLSLGLQGTFDSLNPYNVKAGSAAQGMAINVFQTLLARSTDEAFTLYGLLAESVETDDARSFVEFRLNPKARFSDGVPVTSADVLFSFELLKTRGRPQQRAAFSLVKSVETPDERTIRFDLTGLGDREMPLTLGLIPVLPKHRVDPAKFEETTLEPPVASGPYLVTDVKPGESLILKRNPDYWAKDLPMHRGLFNFDEIRIEYFRDSNSLYEAFKAGLVDYRDETNPTRWLTGYDFPALADGRVKRETLPLGGPKGMQGFAFNTRRPLFQDVRIREALGFMFDFEWINAKLFGGLYTRTKSFFDESDLASVGRPASEAERALLAEFPGVVREDILEGRWAPPKSDGSGRDRNTAQRAVTLFAEAGYRISNGQMTRRDNGQRFEFEILVTDRNQERLALNFSESLRRIGVEARVRVVDEVQYQRRRQKFDFDMMLGTWTASSSPGNEQRSRWGSASASQESSFNLAGAQSPAIDALIVKMLAAHEREDFVSAVRAYDRVLLSGFYIIPLFHSPNQWFAYSTRLQRPERTARFASPLFSSTLDSWWMKP
jgi:peptide/nickel transport system substrate-binding protein